MPDTTGARPTKGAGLLARLGRQRVCWLLGVEKAGPVSKDDAKDSAGEDPAKKAHHNILHPKKMSTQVATASAISTDCNSPQSCYYTSSA